MKWVEDSGPHGRMWIGGYPLYGTTLLIIIHCVALVVCTLLISLGYGGWVSFISFSSVEVLMGRVWKLFTYPLVQIPSLWFPIEMLMLYWFGTPVETFVGRKKYFSLYLALILIPSLFMTALGGFKIQSVLAGTQTINFCLFIAFATIYPDALLLGNIRAKYVAYVYLAISALICLAAHDWNALIVLAISTAVAYFGVKMMGVQGGIAWWDSWMNQIKHRQHQRKHNLRIVQENKMNESIDPILEKISKQGMESLTYDEKRALERARTTLLKKDQGK